jgi:magnesium transporter
MSVDIAELRDRLKLWLKDPEENRLHPSEIATILKYEYLNSDRDYFNNLILKIDKKYLGEVILELPEKYRNIAIEYLSSSKLADAIDGLESDDSTDLIQDIEDIDKSKAQDVYSKLDVDDKAEIDTLRKYDQDEAGAWMQTEFFYAYYDESVYSSLKRLRKLKKKGELQEVYQVFVVDQDMKHITSIRVDNLILTDINLKYKNIIKKVSCHSVTAGDRDDIREIAQYFEQYNLQVVPVLNSDGVMIGRITSDDAYDIISDIATDQMYSMVGVDDEVEQEQDIKEVIKKRGYWLLINLFTAILASLVIGMFDETLQALIPLAILMPIVASMGGNAGTQTLTVVVRQIALGEIESSEAKETIKREIIVSLVNGFIFAVLISLITLFWFGDSMLGVVIAISMVINLFIAGFFGSVIPLFLKRIDVDPAVGSSVLLTTATDVFGFLSFLGLAKIMLVP